MDRSVDPAGCRRADLRQLDGDVGLRQAKHPDPRASRRLLGLGIGATLAANLAHGLVSYLASTTAVDRDLHWFGRPS
jgi:hypothetical protein